MACHVAILRLPYLRMVLAGAKRLESRLTKTATAPFNAIAVGERIFLKASGGPFMATAVAGDVTSHDNLTPGAVAALRRRHNEAVQGDDAYWQAKRDSRFATFVQLCDVEPMDVGPSYARSAYKAWFVLPDEASPLLDVTLSDAAIRNRYVPVAGRPSFFGDGPFALELPGGGCVETTLYRRQRVRWRGWAACFARHGVAAGGRVRFVSLGGRRYRVRFLNPPGADRGRSRRNKGDAP